MKKCWKGNEVKEKEREGEMDRGRQGWMVELWVEGLMDGMNGCIDGSMDRWMDGTIN